MSYRRSLMMSNKDLEIPYITDGLVSCWDGIWNSGIGKHSNNPDDIIDLISGEKVLIGGYAIWDSSDLSNNYSITNKGISNNTRDKSIGIGIPFNLNLGYGWTIEVVRNITQLRSGNHPELRFNEGMLYNGTTLVRYYIPVRIGQVGYLYDKVSKTLFSNANSIGTFLIGNDK